MSYLYRKKKRKACHFILKYLVNNDVPRDSSWEPMEELKRVSIKKFTEISKFGFKELYPAVYLLEKNKHIECNEPNGFIDDHSNIELLPQGKEVYFEGLYLTENRKDLLESIELNTKWILPILSILISLTALFISIFRE